MSDNTLNEWVISSDGGGMQRFVFPKGRSLCALIEVKQITLPRGEKFCRPEKGESPTDQMPKVVFSFMPIQDKVLSLVPEGHVAEINAIFSPSFGPKAKLPPFLTQLSEDGVVPNFGKDGVAFKNWCNMHVGFYYAVNHAPNEAKTRNVISSIAFHSKGDKALTKQVPASTSPTVKTGAEAKRLEAAKSVNVAAKTPFAPGQQAEVPFDDDIEF